MAEDKATAPEASSGDAGAATAPDTTALQNQIQALQAEKLKLVRSYSEAQKTIGRQGAELGEYRKALSYSGLDGVDGRTNDTGTPTPVSEKMYARLSLLAAAVDEPDALRYRNEIAEREADPRYLSIADPSERIITITRDIKVQALADENANLRKQLETANRGNAAVQTTISGQGASELPEGMTLEDVRKMTPTEMEKRGLVNPRHKLA